MSKSKELVVYLKGGLGNQLFQLLAGLHFSKTLGRELLFVDSWYAIKHSKSHSQRSLRVPEISKWLDIKQRQAPLFLRFNSFLRLVRRLPRRLQILFGYYGEIRRDDTSMLELDTRSRFVINGYWMDPPILNEIDLVSNAIQQYCIENKHRYQQLHEFIEDNCVIAMHIRLGDYKDHSDLYDVINFDYYLQCFEEAKNTLEQKYKKVFLWVFTDDILHASAIYSNQFQIDRWVSKEDISSDLDTMCLMSKSRAIICANSSFSWWSAAVSNVATAVYFPEKYMTGKSSEQMGLIRAGWITK